MDRKTMQDTLDLTQITRNCYVCGETKPLTQFRKHAKEPLGYGYKCIDCNRQQGREYHRKHANELNTARREKYQNNLQFREHHKKRSKEYTDKHKHKIKQKRNHMNPYKRAYNLVKGRNSPTYNTKYRTPKKFTITLEYVLDLAEKQKHRCALTGIPFNTIRTKEKNHNALLPSIDRINSDIGYVLGNVQWVTIWANRAKLDYPTEFFQEVCRITAQNNKAPPTYLKSLIPPLPKKKPKTQKINPNLKYFSNVFNPLRKCRECGLEAWDGETLNLFTKVNRLPYGRENICKPCDNKDKREQHLYTTPKTHHKPTL